MEVELVVQVKVNLDSFVSVVISLEASFDYLLNVFLIVWNLHVPSLDIKVPLRKEYIVWVFDVPEDHSFRVKVLVYIVRSDFLV